MLWKIFWLLFPGAYAAMPVPPLLGNELLGQPFVSCDAQHILFFANTSGPFGGNAYTKGFFSIPGCHLRGNSSENLIELAIPTSDKCGVRRKRMMGKKGLELEVTVVLMFHHIFLTKGDRSFNLKCVYAEIETQVTREIDVSTIPPQDLPAMDVQQDQQTQPTCGYDVLFGGPRGDPVRFATIGDAVYHRWHCETGRNQEFCMMVHSCTADDGQGWTQELIDAGGCSLDTFLIPNLQPDGDLSMGQRSQVFKFADRPTVYFNCMIKLQPKSSMEECPMPDEYCGKQRKEMEATVEGINDVAERVDEESLQEELEKTFPTPKVFVPDDHRRKRLFRKSRDVSNRTMDLDVSAPSIDVFDIAIEDKPTAPSSQADLAAREKRSEVCLSRYVFAVSFAFFLCSVMLFIVGLCLCFRRQGKVSWRPRPPPGNFSTGYRTES